MGLLYVKPEDARSFLTGLRKALAEINTEVVEVYRGYALNALHAIVRETPQWSGGAASNWNFDFGQPTYRMDTDLKDADASLPWHMAGMNLRDKDDKRAWEISFARAAVGVSGLTALASTPRGALKLPHIYINNAAKDLDGSSYIQHLEENPGDYLRKENEPGHMVQYTVQNIRGLGSRGVINQYAGPLRSIRLGDVSANLV